MADEIDTARLHQFRAGSLVPTWLIDQEPNAPDSIAAVISFQTDVDVFETPASYVVFCTDMTKNGVPPVLVDHGRSCNIIAPTKHVHIVQGTFSLFVNGEAPVPTMDLHYPGGGARPQRIERATLGPVDARAQLDRLFTSARTPLPQTNWRNLRTGEVHHGALPDEPDTENLVLPTEDIDKQTPWMLETWLNSQIGWNKATHDVLLTLVALAAMAGVGLALYHAGKLAAAGGF